MNIAGSLRNFSLSVATASFLLAGAAFAQSNLVGVNARLDHKLDSSNAVKGQIVTARLDHGVKTADGVDLPGGTELIGKVVRVQASQNGGPAMISILFDKAAPKVGRQVPVKVTVLGAYPANQGMNSIYGTRTLGPAPKHVSPKERVDQEAGLLHHVTMHSSVMSHNSATFRDKSGDVDLNRGTYLQLAVGPASGHAAANNSAM